MEIKALKETLFLLVNILVDQTRQTGFKTDLGQIQYKSE
jgi:hypothetical protein